MHLKRLRFQSHCNSIDFEFDCEQNTVSSFNNVKSFIDLHMNGNMRKHVS